MIRGGWGAGITYLGRPEWWLPQPDSAGMMNQRRQTPELPVVVCPIFNLSLAPLGGSKNGESKDEILGDPITGPRLSGVEFSEGLSDKSLIHGHFTDVSGKKATFEKVDFSYSVFTRAYFHDTIFKDCKFTGCRFNECNFRGAKFSLCDFKYAFFDRTIVPHKQLIACAPAWPNVKRDLMQIMRANAVSVGDIEAERAFIREEMKARREHLRRARAQEEEYYKRKYAGWWNWCSVRWQSFWLFLDRNILGHGEHIGRAVLGSLALLLLIATFQWLYDLDSSDSFGRVVLGFVESAKYVLYLLLDVPSVVAQPPYSLAIVVILLRYFLIGLLVAGLFRVLSHR